jgi:hypothetical protein
LRQETGADFATLIFSPLSRGLADSLHLVSGDAPASAISEMIRSQSAAADPHISADMIEGRVYSLLDLIASESRTGSYGEIFQILAEQGLTGVRQMRVRARSGIDAWLTILCRSGDFNADNDRLLEELAPQLRGGHCQDNFCGVRESADVKIHAATADAAFHSAMAADRQWRMVLRETRWRSRFKVL